jgi:voltage-gated potassium channel Kch
MTPGFRGILAHKQSIRLFGIIIVFFLGISAFVSGVDTSGVEDMSELSIFAWIYYSAGLFVFGGLDLGVPVGGSAAGRGALWIAYFLAPIITTTTVIEAALQLIRRDRFQARALDGHVVVIGAGRLGLTYIQAVRHIEPERQLLLVDAEGDKISAEEAGLLEGIQFVRTSLDRREAFQLLHLERAARMIVVSDNDLLNLEIAWTAKSYNSDLPVAVHVTDLTLLRPVSRLIRDRASADASPASLPLVFNTHRIAALHLYEQFLHPHFEETGYRDVVVLGGFGRFPQTILELLKVAAKDELEHIVIVDKEASKNVRQFGADVSLDTISYSTVDGDLEDPGTWTEVDGALESHTATPVFLLASANEVVNFRSAMMLRRRSSEVRIFARCFRRSSFAQLLARENAFELLAFEEVFQQALRDHYETLAAL